MSAKNYFGSDGYNKMLNELKSSLFDAYPQYKNRVFVVSGHHFGEQEIANAEKALGLVEGDFKKQLAQLPSPYSMNFISNPRVGVAIPMRNKDGKLVVVAKNAVFAASIEAETPETIYYGARNLTHEIGHALLSLSNPENDRMTNLIGAKSVFDNVADKTLKQVSPVERIFLSGLTKAAQFDETFSEVFANSLFVHNGANPKELLGQSAALYDASKIGFNPYSPSAEFAQLKKYHQGFLTSGPKELQSYRLSGWNEAYRISHELTTRNKSKDAAAFYEEWMQSNALGATAQQHLAGMKPEELTEWFKDRASFIQDGSQIVAGMKYLQDFMKTKELANYTTVQPQSLSLEQAAGRAYKKFIETGSDADRTFATELLKSTFDLDDMGFRKAFNLTDDDVTKLISQKGKSDWADMLASGMKVEDVASEIRASAGHYTVSPIEPRIQR